MLGNQQDVLIILIRQTQRAQKNAKNTRVYIQNEAHKPQKPLQGLDRTPNRYCNIRFLFSPSSSLECARFQLVFQRLGGLVQLL